MTSTAFKIVHPHLDVYEEHIQVFGSYYVDKSVKGHFTIGACRLNRKIREFGWVKDYDDAAVAAAATKYLELEDPIARVRAFDELREKIVLT